MNTLEENEVLIREMELRAESNCLARNAAMIERLRITNTNLRDLLTSAHAIAARGGEDTNWEAFIGQLKERGIGSITAKVFKLPKDESFGAVLPTSSLNSEGFCVLGNPAAFTRVIGQAWCRTTEHHPKCMELVSKPQTLDFSASARTVLCAIHQNVTTGEMTYVPISFDDLPQVTETPAS